MRACGSFGTDLSECLQAVHLGHRYVHEDAIGPLSEVDLDCQSPVFGLDDLMAGLDEQLGRPQTHEGRVVHDEDLCHRRCS